MFRTSIPGAPRVRRTLLRLTALALVWAYPGVAGAQEPAAAAPAAAADGLMDALGLELKRSFTELQGRGAHPLYFLAYRAEDERNFGVTATDGVISNKGGSRFRRADAEVRVGTAKLDNTHRLREMWDWDSPASVGLPVEDDVDAIRAELWRMTDQGFKAAQERLTKVLANKKVKVEEQDQSDDFAAAEPQTWVGPVVAVAIDEAALQARARALSARFAPYPHLLDSAVTISVQRTVRYFVSTEGHRIRQCRPHARLMVSARSKAEDGMDLELSESYDAPTVGQLPGDDVVAAGIATVATRLAALRAAPLVEPFTGPAIVMNRAAGVFFHEIFGHRIEGHRQKDEEEGQTFTKKVGEQILPEFIDVVSDPTVEREGAIFLNGTYRYDDEGVKAGPVHLVEQGVLRGFMMSRSPIDRFPASNGHGRGNIGASVVARQANLLVRSKNEVPFPELRSRLIELCKGAGKSYGLIFHDISGGFTTTTRGGPQAFKVVPLFVEKLYLDGHTEVVRGVDMVGTPLSSLRKIVATARDTDVFNGYCGAESGWIPVSAVAPSLLVSEIEVEKKLKEQGRPPLLEAPTRTLKSDAPLFDILQTEMARATGSLRMDDQAPPYYVAFTVDGGESQGLAASFGALVGDSGGPWRRYGVDLRVGDYVLDNTNARRGGREGSGGALSLEDDELAVRRELWRTCDGAYKQALEALAAKKAALQTMSIPDRPDDLQRLDPVVTLEPLPALTLDKSAWTVRVRRLSAIFREFPGLQDSSVRLEAGNVNRHFVNSEGFQVRTGTTGCWLWLWARTQAADGMDLGDERIFYARTPAELPADAVLEAAVRELAARVTALGKAPRAEEYVGPVLLEDEAVAGFLMQLLVQNLSNPREALRGGGGTVFKNRLKRRICSPTLTVVDDPTLETWNGTPLLGHFAVDDDGVPAARITLVQNGILRTWYMSRVPTEKVKGTNGHSREGNGGPGNVIVTATDAKPRAAVVRELLDLAREQELPYALVLSQYGRGPGAGMPRVERIYVSDGHRELVRGGTLQRVTLRALRDVLRCAEGEMVTHQGSGKGGVSVVHPPAMLIDEMELKEPRTQEGKLPILPHPFFAGRDGAAPSGEIPAAAKPATPPPAGEGAKPGAAPPDAAPPRSGG